MPEHNLLGTYRINRNPYRIIFKDGVNYRKHEAEKMSKMDDDTKKLVHLVKDVFGGEIQ